MKKSISAFFAAIAFATAGLAQGQLVDTKATDGQPVLIEHMIKTDQPGDLTIPYSKFKLANGLTLIVMEDHSDPIVHVDVTYHVGSAREEAGKSGFAHFFEHMMFQGSKDVASGEHFHIVTAAGGTMNGNTTEDRTRYFETVPKNYLETALWLEADRMGFLLDSVTQRKFEVQRATVKNEKAQNYDNRPYGRLSEIMQRSFYPFDHPYSWPTIGYVPDLNRVGVEDLKKFFLRWYGPNNAVLTVGGDVNTFDVVQMVQKYFGSIPKGPDVVNQKPIYFNFDKDRYISMEDNVRAPLLVMAYPGVAAYSEDEAALDLLAQLMSGGKSSIFYQAFVKAQKASYARIDDNTSELGGQFSINILANPGTKLSDMEALVRDCIKKFGDEGFTDADLDRVKTQEEAQFIYRLESVSNKVNQLSDYQTYLGNPNYIREDLKRYQNVTKQDIMRVFEVYVKDAHCLVASVYPKGQKDLEAGQDNYTPGGDTTKIKHQNYDTLKPRTVKDNFDRSKEPKPGPEPSVNAPKYYTISDPIMAKTTGVVNNEVPDVFIQFNFEAGENKDPWDKAGLAYLTSKMLMESNARMSGDQLSDEFDRMGTDINVSVNHENMVITVHCLTKNLDHTLMLIGNMLNNSKVDPKDFDRVKHETLQAINNQSVRATSLADNEFNKLLYGEYNPYSYPTMGTKKSLEFINAPDVMNFMHSYVTLSNAKVFVSGDITDQQLRGKLMLMAGPGMAPPPPPILPGQIPPPGQPAQPGANGQAQSAPMPPVIEKTKIYLVNKDHAPQSEIRIGYLAMPYDATGPFFKASVMNIPLGGVFSSRLNLYIREQKGYTYGIRSSFDGDHTAGPFEVSAGVRADVTDSSLIDALNIIKNYAAKGMTKEELEFTKSAIVDREALRYETNAQKVRYIERMVAYSLDGDYVNEELKELKKIKLHEINKIAKEDLPTDKMVIVVVGDAKTLKDKLAKLGYDVVEVEQADSGNTNPGR